MALMLFVKGLLVGFMLAIPVGPIGLLCIGRSLAKGRISGVCSGLGAATADAVLGAVAGFGITFISSFLVSHQMPLRLAGGAVLVFLGFHIALTEPPSGTGDLRDKGLIGDYVSAFFLTLTNPLTILAFAAGFATLGVEGAARKHLVPLILVTGVFTGSALWWVMLSTIVGWCRNRITPKKLRLINKVSGCAIALFGFAVFLSAILIILSQLLALPTMLGSACKYPNLVARKGQRQPFRSKGIV